MDDLEKLLWELVAARSVGPREGDPSRPGFNELEVGKIISDFLKACGLSPQRQAVRPYRENVYAIAEGRRKDGALLLEAHMDTVDAGTWGDEAFQPVIKQGRLYGRGSCDTKGSLAAMLLALKRLLDRGAPERTIVFLASCDEEASHAGALEFTKLGLPVKWAVVGEPTQLFPVIAHKGIVRWKVRCRGKSAHAATPEEGVNAIYRMARVVLRLDEYNRVELAKRSHPSLGAPTLSVGTISGGTAVNIVPEMCEVQVDRRTLPDEDNSRVQAEAMEYVRSGKGTNFDVEADEPFISACGIETPPDAPIVRLVSSACERIAGNSETKAVSYCTDAWVFSESGATSVVLGPGDASQAHAVGEFVDLVQLHKAADIYLQVVEGAGELL